MKKLYKKNILSYITSEEKFKLVGSFVVQIYKIYVLQFSLFEIVVYIS